MRDEVVGAVDLWAHEALVERVPDTAARLSWSSAIFRIDEVCRPVPSSQQALVRELLDRLAAAMTDDVHAGPS